MLSALLAGRALLPEIYSGTHFCQRLGKPRGHGATGRIRCIEGISDLIGSSTRDIYIYIYLYMLYAVLKLAV
jgi:hypothetical protein